MLFVTDPWNGLQFHELPHMWGCGVPSYPSNDDVILDHGVRHAQFGVQAHKIRTNFHAGTHTIAPIHMQARGEDSSQITPPRFSGSGVILDPRNKKNWDKITADDLKAAGEIQNGDIVAINTGWHIKYSDSMEYFGEVPGSTEDAANYLISKRPKFIAIDIPSTDYLAAMSLTPHLGRPGPYMKRLPPIYKGKAGRDTLKDHPGFYLAYKALAATGIPVIQQMGSNVDEITGKHATMIVASWRIWRGDVRLVRFAAIFDLTGEVRIDTGV